MNRLSLTKPIQEKSEGMGCGAFERWRVEKKRLAEDDLISKDMLAEIIGGGEKGGEGGMAVVVEHAEGEGTGAIMVVGNS